MVKYAGFQSAPGGVTAYDPAGLISRTPDRSFYTTGQTSTRRAANRPNENIGKYGINPSQPFAQRDTLSLGLEGIDGGKQPGVIPSLLGSVFGDAGFFVGDILDTPFDILSSIPSLGPNSYRQDTWDADIKRAYEYEANQNPLNALFSISKASRLQWDRDVERGVAPGPAILSDMLGPSASLGNQIFNLFMGLGVPGRLIERTVLGANGRVNNILEPSPEALEDPWVSQMYDRYKAGDFGSGQEARDRIMDEMVVNGRGYSDNPWVAMGLSVITDPLILLSVGAGLGTHVAATGARTITARLGNLAHVADAAKAEIALARKLSLDDATHLFKTDMALRDEALMKVSTRFPDDLARIKDEMNTIQAWASTVEPTLRPIKRIIDRLNDPFTTFFGGGNAGRLANGYLSHGTTEGVLSAHDMHKVTGWLNRIRETNPEFSARMEKAIGVYAVNIARFQIRDWMRGQVARFDKWITMHPDMVVAERLRGFGSDIKKHVEDYSRRVKPQYLPSGKGPEAEAAAIAAMREGTARRLALMGLPEDEARAIAATVDRDIAGFIDAGYFGDAIDDLLTAKASDEAAGLTGTLGEDHARLTMAGPHELTKDRSDALVTALQSTTRNMDWIRAEVREIEALSSLFMEGGMEDADLVRELLKFLTENADSFPTVISDLDTLGPAAKAWAQRNAEIGYRPMLGPKEGAEWRPVAFDGDKKYRIAPFIGYTNEAASVKHYNNMQRLHNRMLGEIRGNRIVMEARKTFVMYGATQWGLDEHHSHLLFNHLITAANEAGVTPRGLDAERWFAVVMKSDLPPEVLGKMTKRDAVDAMLASFEGDWWTVGATQKLTGSIKRISAESNFFGRMAEAAYPLVRFQLNAFFQVQELIEAPFFSILHGIKPGWKMSETDEITARVIDMMMDKGRWTFDDQIEYSRHVLAGLASTRRGFGPSSGMGRMAGKFSLPVRRVKMINYYRLAKKNLGEEFYQRLEEIKPGAWAELRDHFGTANKGEVAMRYLSERLRLTGAIDAGDFEGVSELIAMTKPELLGARTQVHLDPLARMLGYEHIPGGTKPGARLIADMQNGTLDPDTVRQGLELLGADPAYIDNALQIATMGYTPDEFFTTLRALLPVGQRGQATALRAVWQARARAMGISEEQFLARKMAGLPIGMDEATIRGLKEADIEGMMYMAEAMMPGHAALLAARTAGDIPIGIWEGRTAYIREVDGVRHRVVIGDDGEVWSRGRVVDQAEYDALMERGQEILSGTSATPAAPIERLGPDDFKPIYDADDAIPHYQTPRFREAMKAVDESDDPAVLLPFVDDIIEVGDKVYGSPGGTRLGGYAEYQKVKAGDRDPDTLTALVDELDSPYLQGDLPIPDGTYLYHNTGYITLEEIRKAGYMRTSKGGDLAGGAGGPGYHTPVVWFTTDPKDAAGYNANGMIRVKASAKYKFRPETSMMQTDVVTTKRVAVEDIEFLGKDGQWHPLADAPTPGSVGPSPLHYFNDDPSALQFIAYRSEGEWSGVTINMVTGEEIKVGQAASVGKTLEIPIGTPPREVERLIGQYIEENSELLGRPGHHLGTFNNPDKGTIDIDVNLVTNDIRDAEALQLAAGRDGGAYDFASGNGVYAPLTDPFPSARPEGGTLPPGTLDAERLDAMMPPQHIVDVAPDEAFAAPVESTHVLTDGRSLYTPGGASRLDDPDNRWTLWEEQKIFAQMINPGDVMTTPEGRLWLAKVYRGIWNAKESRLDTPEAVINRFIFAANSPNAALDLNQASASRLRVNSQQHLEDTIAPMIDEITEVLDTAGVDINDARALGFAFQINKGWWRNASDDAAVDASSKPVEVREFLARWDKDGALLKEDEANELLKAAGLNTELAWKPYTYKGQSNFYVKTPKVAFRGQRTNGAWGDNIKWLRDVFLHENPEVRSWLLRGANEGREAYAERMAAVLPGLQLKTGYFGADIGGPHLLNRAILDTQYMGDHFARIFAGHEIPKTWAEAMQIPEFARYYGGDDAGEWFYHGTSQRFADSIRDNGMFRGEWVSDPNSPMIPKYGGAGVLYRTRRTAFGEYPYEKAPGWMAGGRIPADNLQISRDGGRTWQHLDGRPALGAPPETLKRLYEKSWRAARRRAGLDQLEEVPATTLDEVREALGIPFEAFDHPKRQIPTDTGRYDNEIPEGMRSPVRHLVPDLDRLETVEVAHNAFGNFVPIPGTERPIEYVYRAMSEEEWQEALARGYMKSDGRMNLHADEGTVAKVGDPSYYLWGGDAFSVPGTYPRRIVKIAVNEKDGWWRNPSDSYLKTPKEIPIDRAEQVSPVITRDIDQAGNITQRIEPGPPIPKKKPADDPWRGTPIPRGKSVSIIGTVDKADWRAQVKADRAGAIARARAGIAEKIAPEHPELAASLLRSDDIVEMAMNKGNGKIVVYGGEYRFVDEVAEHVKRDRAAEYRASGNAADAELADLIDDWSRAEFQWFDWDGTRGIVNPESSMHGGADAIPSQPYDDLIKNIALMRKSGTDTITPKLGGSSTGRQLEQGQHGLMFMEEGDRILGATATMADSKKLLILTEHADVRTLLHESFHIFASDIDPSGIRVIKHEFARAMNTPSTGGRNLTKQEEEWAADLFHEYFRTGKARIPEMAETLGLFRNWLDNTYGAILNREAKAKFAAETAAPARADAIAARKVVRGELGKAKAETINASNAYRSASEKLQRGKAARRKDAKKGVKRGRRYDDPAMNRWGYAERDAKARLVRARNEQARLEKELRKAEDAVQKARDLRAPRVPTPRATVGHRGTMSIEMKQFFDDLFKVPDEPRRPSLTEALRAGRGAYDPQEEAVWGAAHAAAIAAEDRAFTTHFYKRGRSWLERSMNHPYLGLYPLSYMWGKVLPEMFRFLVKEPFGVPAPGAGLMAAQNIYRQVLVQKETDPEFREWLSTNEKAFRALAMLLPATPWELPVNAPLWVRRMAEIGANNSMRDPGEEPKTIGLKEAGNIVTDTASWAFGPAQNFRVAADFASLATGAPIDFGAELFNDVQNELQGVLGGVTQPSGFREVMP